MNGMKKNVIRRALLVAMLMMPLLSGCLKTNCRFAWSPFHRQPILPPDISKAELVDHLNQNINNLYSWRSTDIRITAREKGGIPVRLSAFLAVETPRKLRLKVDSVMGAEVDLGSNFERFWFWSKRNEPSYVLTASHKQTAVAQQRMQLPVDPEWLMEALGVIPIDETTISMDHDAERQRARLISNVKTSHGRPVRKAIVVDTSRGWIIERSLFDHSNRLIARAEYSGHTLFRGDPDDERDDVVVPRQIKMQWPDAGLSLTMHIDSHEINPAEISERTWQMPRYPNSPVVDIGRR